MVFINVLRNLDRNAPQSKDCSSKTKAYWLHQGAAQIKINRPRVRIEFRQSDDGAFIERLKAEIAAMEKRDHNAGICLRCQTLKKMNDVLKRFAPDEWSLRETVTYCDEKL